MVTQPAYLRDLKAYTRERHSSDPDYIDESMKDLNKESDRGAIILAGTSLEDMLEYRIHERLPGLHKDETARKDLFERDGNLSTFSAKIEMAYALGIIDKRYRAKIDLVREIRNACAHSRKPLSLKTPVLRAAVEAAINYMLRAIKDHEPETLRMAFLTHCANLAMYAGTGEKIETPEDQIRLYARLRKQKERGEL